MFLLIQELVTVHSVHMLSGELILHQPAPISLQLNDQIVVTQILLLQNARHIVNVVMMMLVPLHVTFNKQVKPLLSILPILKLAFVLR